MLKEVTLLTLISAFATPSAAEIYQCSQGGQTLFSDSPCGSDAKEIQVDPITVGGQLDTGTDVEFYDAPERKRASQNNDCPFINSTDLRRLTIQNKIVRGMKPADVRKSWGSPSSIRTGSRTQWAYHYPDYSANYVYFENGCVSDWSGYYRNN